MTILLVIPPLQRLSEVRNSYFPLGLGYLASYLSKEGYHVRIYNSDKGLEEKKFSPISSNWERIKRHSRYVEGLKNPNHIVWREIGDIISSYEPDLLGITVMTTTFPSALNVAHLCKEKYSKCIVTMGGIHPTVQPHKVMEYADVDYVIRGEGERTLLELVNYLRKEEGDLCNIRGLVYRKNGELKHNPPRELIEDINTLPFPGRELVLRPELYTSSEMGAIVTSRGCPFECTFCEADQLWTRKVRIRSTENIVKELELVVRTYDAKDFRFNDDSFTVGKKRTLDLMDQIIERKLNINWTCLSRVNLIDDDILSAMKRAGCTSISFGIESGSERIRKQIKKGIDEEMILKALCLVRKHKIRFSCCFMIGLPYETKEDVLESIDLMKKINADFTNVCTFTPYPGSPIYEDCVCRGLIDENVDWGKFSHHSSYNRFIKDIPEEDFHELFDLMVKTADTCNTNLNLPYLLDRVKSRWRFFLKNSNRFFVSSARTIRDSLASKHKVSKAPSVFDD